MNTWDLMNMPFSLLKQVWCYSRQRLSCAVGSTSISLNDCDGRLNRHVSKNCMHQCPSASSLTEKYNTAIHLLCCNHWCAWHSYGTGSMYFAFLHFCAFPDSLHLLSHFIALTVVLIPPLCYRPNCAKPIWPNTSLTPYILDLLVQ